jgi:hypothetical protein
MVGQRKGFGGRGSPRGLIIMLSKFARDCMGASAVEHRDHGDDMVREDDSSYSCNGPNGGKTTPELFAIEHHMHHTSNRVHLDKRGIIDTAAEAFCQ